MKKQIMILAILFMISSILTAEQMQPNMLPKAMKSTGYIYDEPSSREAPSWEFIISPLWLITTYYDYMPGSYNGIPVQVQPQNPGNCEGGGVYIVYHAQASPTGQRKIHFRILIMKVEWCIQVHI